MATISQTTFSNTFSWMKMLECRFNFHWNLVLRVQLTINQHWFRYWLVAFLAPSHYQKQCWPSSLMHICSTRGRWVKSLANREGPGFALRILKRVLLPVAAHQTTLEWQWPREWDPCPCALRPIELSSGREWVVKVFIQSSWQATLQWIPQGENYFQIRNSPNWHLNKEHSHGEVSTLLMRETEYSSFGGQYRDCWCTGS